MLACALVCTKVVICIPGPTNEMVFWHLCQSHNELSWTDEKGAPNCLMYGTIITFIYTILSMNDARGGIFLFDEWCNSERFGKKLLVSKKNKSQQFAKRTVCTVWRISYIVYSIIVTSWWARLRLKHQPHDCLPNLFFRRRSKKTSKLCVAGLCAGISPGTDEFPAQMACYAKMFPFDDVIMV